MMDIKIEISGGISDEDAAVLRAIAGQPAGDPDAAVAEAYQRGLAAGQGDDPRRALGYQLLETVDAIREKGGSAFVAGGTVLIQRVPQLNVGECEAAEHEERDSDERSAAEEDRDHEAAAMAAVHSTEATPQGRTVSPYGFANPDREPFKPSPGKKRRSSDEVAEDKAYEERQKGAQAGQAAAAEAQQQAVPDLETALEQSSPFPQNPAPEPQYGQQPSPFPPPAEQQPAPMPQAPTAPSAENPFNF